MSKKIETEVVKHLLDEPSAFDVSVEVESVEDVLTEFAREVFDTAPSRHFLVTARYAKRLRDAR